MKKIIKNPKFALAVFVLVSLLTMFFLKSESIAAQVEQMPIRGAIQAVQRDDGSIWTYFDITIGRKFPGRLPQDIDSISVTGPKGGTIIRFEDFKYSSRWRSFWFASPGAPEIGTYLFQVISHGKVGYSTDIQHAVRTIPQLETLHFRPATGESLHCTPARFSWRNPRDQRTLYSQIEIRNSDKQLIYRSAYVEEMDSLRLPADILKAGRRYQWRVRIGDSPDWIALNNRTQSSWIPFSTPESFNFCKYEYNIPARVTGSWQVSTPQDSDVDLRKITELMNRILSGGLKNIHSILLIKSGKLVLEEYFEGYHRNLKHNLASVTKSVTSILIGIAHDQGFVDPQQVLSAYLPKYNDVLSVGKKEEITLFHLLTMRAGLEWNEFSLDEFRQLYKSRDSIQYVLEKKIVHNPGSFFFYNTGLSTVLGRIIKNTTGLDADLFARRFLFSPLEISDLLWKRAADGTVLTGSSLYLRPRDMAKLGYLIQQGGLWHNKRLISARWVRESIHPYVIYPTDKGDLISGTGYGYQWWLGSSDFGDRKINAFYAAGHGGQFIGVIPELDAIIVLTSRVENNNAGDFLGYSIIENFLIPALVRAESNETVISFDTEKYRHLAGNYRWPKGELDLKIFNADDGIFGKTVLFEDRFEMLPTGKDRFRCNSPDVGRFHLDVVRDGKGEIKGVNIVIGFSYIPFERKRSLFFGF